MSPPALVLLLLAALGTGSPVRKTGPNLETLNRLFPLTPPHCSKAVVTPSRPSLLAGFTSTQVQKNRLNIGVGQTVCFKSDTPTNESAPAPELHTLTLSRLEQYHAITQRYRFAIPEVETRCVCECSAKSAVCRAENYSYGKCASGYDLPSACHRTFFPDQPGTGCPAGANEPRLCCELKFQPFQNRTYTALKLETPTAFAILHYTAFAWANGLWRETAHRMMRVRLNSATQNQFLDATHSLELSVNPLGRSSNQLEAGMYFVENLSHAQYGEVMRQPLNEITDHSFERLGWFRQNANEHFFVHNGFIMLDRVHRAKAENCLEQKYQSILDANFYVNKDSNHSTRFQMAEPLSRTHRWIKSAHVVDSAERHVIVSENEGTNLDITLTALDPLAFVHNVSVIEDFAGTILVDKFSNSVFNVTVFNASGILNGYVKKLDDYRAEQIESFTLHVSEALPTTRQLLVRLMPYPANSVQMVCLRPDDAPISSEVCRPVQSVMDELASSDTENRWVDRVDECPECNQVSMDGIMKYLNPMTWTNGISSINDFIMVATDVFIYLVVFVVLYTVICKCLWPMLKCYNKCLNPLSFCCFRSKK